MPTARPSLVPTTPAILFALLALSPCAQAQRVPLSAASPVAATLTDAGVLPASQSITLRVRLAPTPDRAAALTQRLADQLDPASPFYREWLTPSQFGSEFGATDSQLATAQAWLEAQGLTIASTAASRTALTATGSATQVAAAFAVSLHQFQTGSTTVFANATHPSLPAEAAALITGVSGLDNLTPDSFAAIAATLEANTTPVLTIPCAAYSDSEAWSALLRQANAQGITALSTPACPAAELTALNDPAAPSSAAIPALARPSWQFAAGLPSDALRYTPDLTANRAAFAQTIASIAAQSSTGRLGNIDATLYQLAPTPGLYTQPDAAPAGTWEAATGLGTIDLALLAKVFPRGSTQSFIALTPSSYAPVHGASETFTAKITGGGTTIATGTITFQNNGATIGTGVLDATGTASFTTTALPGGAASITAIYPGDSTFAAITSQPTTFTVQPEASKLVATVSTGNTVGGTYTVAVTDTAPSGVGQPTGTITVTLSGTTTTYTGALVAGTAGSSAVTITIPASTVGISTLSITCTASPSYSCDNPYTATVTVAKATPVLTISVSPNPPVSGAAIVFLGTMAAVGTAPVPTGNVSFFDNGTVINAGKLASGTVSVSGTDITADTHTITATYDGDANYASVNASTTSSSATTASTTSLSANAIAANGQSITFTAGVAPIAATGNVQFLDGTTVLGAFPVASGAASLTTSTLSTTAAHSVTAVYSGDAKYAASTSPAVVIAKGSASVSTVTTLSATANAANGTPITFSANIGSTSLANNTFPTGVLQFYDGATLLATQPVVGTGASYTTSALSTSVGHTIIATYTGDSSYLPSSSTPLILSKSTGGAISSTALVATPAVITLGTGTSFTATVLGSIPTTLPTGNVQFLNGNTILCSTSITGNTATCGAVTSLPLGADTITAIYLGDTTYAVSSGTALVTVSAMAVTATSGTLAATVLPISAPYNTTTTVTAVLTIPTGTLLPTGIAATASIPSVTSIVTAPFVATTATTATATLVLPVPVPGAYTITVGCGVSTTFTCAIPATAAFTATKGTSATILSVLSGSNTAGQTLTLGATVVAVPAGLLTALVPSGTVLFYDNGVLLGMGTVSAAGVASPGVHRRCRHHACVHRHLLRRYQLPHQHLGRRQSSRWTPRSHRHPHLKRRLHSRRHQRHLFRPRQRCRQRDGKHCRPHRGRAVLRRVLRHATPHRSRAAHLERRRDGHRIALHHRPLRRHPQSLRPLRGQHGLPARSHQHRHRRRHRFQPRLQPCHSFGHTRRDHPHHHPQFTRRRLLRHHHPRLHRARLYRDHLLRRSHRALRSCQRRHRHRDHHRCHPCRRTSYPPFFFRVESPVDRLPRLPALVYASAASPPRSCPPHCVAFSHDPYRERRLRRCRQRHRSLCRAHHAR